MSNIPMRGVHSVTVGLMNMDTVHVVLVAVDNYKMLTISLNEIFQM